MISLKSYAIKTDQGPYLQVNEDAIEIDLVNQLYLLFDGFGGAGVGDRVVTKLKDQVRAFYTKIGGDPDSTLPFFYSPKYLIEGNALINAMNYAHKELTKDNAEKEMSMRGGASAIGVAMAENILTMASIGSCVSYLYRKGNLETLTLADSLSSLSKDSYEECFQTIPLSGFGLFEDFHLQVREIRIDQGDSIVMMTDGAYGRLERRELRHIMAQGDRGSHKIDEIFKLANSRGNLDNQSCIILQF